MIFLDRSRLCALIVFIFAQDLQIQVAHALCKQGCRLISYTANIRLVTIATCYNCRRSPLLQRQLKKVNLFTFFNRYYLLFVVLHFRLIEPTFRSLCINLVDYLAFSYVAVLFCMPVSVVLKLWSSLTVRDVWYATQC